jgi:Uma2 family endonuclease
MVVSAILRRGRLTDVLDPAHIIPDAPRPLRRAEYERMVELGFFENERVELLYGTVVRMSPHGAPHDATVQRLNELLVLALHGRAGVRVQSAFAASDGSEPEPDIAVVPPGDHDAAHPSAAWLIVEVADSSLVKDRTVKGKLYGESGVSEYWVVNLADAIIEVHTEIVGGSYSRVTPYRKGESIALRQFPDVQIPVTGALR